MKKEKQLLEALYRDLTNMKSALNKIITTLPKMKVDAGKSKRLLNLSVKHIKEASNHLWEACEYTDQLSNRFEEYTEYIGYREGDTE